MLMPTSTEYQDAIQNPRFCFCHPDLQQALPEPNEIGLPRPYSGSFAVVFPMTKGSSKWAVRCFSTYHQDQKLRYEKISQYLRLKQPSCMVGFDFLEQGIKVKGKWYPILKMEWVHGDTLNKFIEKNLKSPQEIQSLAQKFLQLVSELRRFNIAHGDLQHGNILVVNGCFRLVDYDGMYVPGLDGMTSNELGHRNYQHPSRTALDFGPYLDNFSAWSIYIALLALSVDPGLRRLVNANDDHLLFRRNDIEAPDSSLVLRSLEKIKDGNLQSLVSVFRTIIYCPDVSQIPPLDLSQVPLTTVKPEEVKDQMGTTGPDLSWITGHLRVSKVRVLVPSILEGAFTKAFIIASFILYYFSLKGAVMPLEVAIPLTFGTFSLLLLILNARFNSRPEISTKTRLSSELNDLKNKVKNIENQLNKLVSDKGSLDQEKGRKVGEITVKQHNTGQLERNEIGKIDIDLRNILSNISLKRQPLSQSESTELAKALESIQSQFLSSKLSQHDLTSKSIIGIGPEMTKRLWANGIKTAADISNVQIVQQGYGHRVHEVAYIEVPRRGRVHVDGIGPKKAQSLLSWRQGLERGIKSYIPKSLPSAQENAIKSKYLAQRQSLDAQEADAKKYAAQAKDLVKVKYRKEQEVLERQIADARNLFAKQLKDLEDRIVIENKNLSNNRYKSGILEHKLKPYLQIRFSNYLKRALF